MTDIPWKSFLKIGLELLLITAGVSLGLLSDQWRESVGHRELAQASLQRFRSEVRINRGNVLRVKDKHVTQLKELEAYLRAHNKELIAHRADPTKPIPDPVPDATTDSAVFDYSAWDLALATQSLAYIDPELVASISSVNRMQQLSEDAHRAIAQASYSFANEVDWLRGVTTYFGDAVIYEDLLMKRYDEILPRLDEALDKPPATTSAVK